jgi:methyl-accepting chemotaxis protein
MTKSSRKSFIINKKFQYSLIGYFLFLSLVMSAINFLGIWYFFSSIKEQAFIANLPGDHVFIDFLSHQKTILLSIFFIVSALTFLVVFFLGVMISHKIAGPLYRLKKHLESTSTKTVSPVEFRKGDYFNDLKDAFNEFIKRS